MAYNRVLYEFQAVIDIDIGIAQLMNEEYNNPEFVNTKMLGLSLQEYKAIFLNRIYENPLMGFLKRDFWSEADSLRKDQMIENPEVYNRILTASPGTAILLMIESIAKEASAGLSSTILCRNETEVQFVEDHIKSAKAVLSDDFYFTNFDVSDYDTIFVKSIRTPSMFANMEGKNLYVLKYRFNMDESAKTTLDKSYCKRYALSANEIYLIDVYNNMDYSQLENISKEEEDEE